MIGPQFPDEVKEEISKKVLRQFAGISLVFFGALFTVSWYRHVGHPTVAGWIAGVLAVVVGLPGLLWPGLIRPLYLGAMAVTKPLGHLMGMLMMGIIYFGLITPLAVFFRLIRRDNLVRQRSDVSTYWTPKPEPTDDRSYLRQYFKQ